MKEKNILMIIAPENFRDEELMEPKEVFENEGAKVVIASKGVDSAKGMLGAVVTVDKDINEVEVEEYDAVVFVGGSGSSIYFEDEIAQKIATEAYEKEKIVAAICIAPSILANAGLLEDKSATSFESQKENLIENDADYTGNGVEADGRIITANGPDSALEFGEKIIEALN